MRTKKNIIESDALTMVRWFPLIHIKNTTNGGKCMNWVVDAV